VSEPVWRQSRRRALWCAEYSGWDLRIEACNFRFQWVGMWAGRELMRGALTDTVQEAQAAAVEAVDRRMME
jgi:hypothetical protein